MKKFISTYLSPIAAVAKNILLLYIVYFLARMVYLLLNWSYFAPTLSMHSFGEILYGGLVFDTSAILVTNIPFFVFILFPLHWKESHIYQQVCRWYFVIINSFMTAANLCDAVYFKYTMRRTTTTVFQEFHNEGNLFSIFTTEALNHWYLVLLFAGIVYVLWHFYSQPKLYWRELSWWRYDLTCLLSLAAIAPFVVAGIRGGFSKAVRPITISNANQYVDRPNRWHGSIRGARVFQQRGGDGKGLYPHPFCNSCR